MVFTDEKDEVAFRLNFPPGENNAHLTAIFLNFGNGEKGSLASLNVSKLPLHTVSGSTAFAFHDALQKNLPFPSLPLHNPRNLRNEEKLTPSSLESHTITFFNFYKKPPESTRDKNTNFWDSIYEPWLTQWTEVRWGEYLQAYPVRDLTGYVTPGHRPERIVAAPRRYGRP